MILYKTLDKTSDQILHQTFIEAFCDYEIKVDLPFWKFQQMLQRKGYHPEISIGAFQNEALVGLALNGLRNWNGKTTAYDIATGVVPERRRKGITSSMFLHIKELLQEKQVEQYLLEVIDSNQPAIELYQKQNFKNQRELSCFLLNKNQFVPRKNHEVEEVDRIDLEQMKGFWNYKPSWQNSVESINAVPEAFIYLVVKCDNAIVGYGVIDKKTGDIPQMAVKKEYRGNGIASSIMAEMVQVTEAEEICVINVEAQQKSVENFLLKSGFAYDGGQFEMLLNL